MRIRASIEKDRQKTSKKAPIGVFSIPREVFFQYNRNYRATLIS